MAGKGNTPYRDVPQGYTGPTKVIGSVTVPEYVTEGTWQQQADGSWRFTDQSGKRCADSWVPAYNGYGTRQRDRARSAGSGLIRKAI